MDVFPGLVVLTSLKALAHRPQLWGTYNNGDNLIFTAEDFVQVDRTSLWAELAEIPDRELADLVLLLKQCCDVAWQPTGPLEALIATGVVVPPPPPDPMKALAPPTPARQPDPLVPAVTASDGLDWEVTLPLGAAVAAAPAAAPHVAAGALFAAPAPVAHAPVTTLPPPPAPLRPTMHAPVTHHVPVAAGGGRNPFGPPSLGPAGGATPAPVPSAAPAVRLPTMARGFAGWAVAAFLMNWLLGIPMLVMAHLAQKAKRQGDMDKAVRLSHRTRAWSIGIVVVMVAILALVVVGSSGSSSP
jgi:hypothetical protein